MSGLVAVVMTLTLSTAPAMAGPHEDEAERLLELAGTKASMESMTDMMLAQQLEQNPGLMPYEGVMRTFLEKYLSYDALKGEIIAIYKDAFTLEELREMNAFYSTDVGKKATLLLPELIQKGGEMGARQVQANVGELQQMIKAEAERLQAEQEQQQQ